MVEKARIAQVQIGKLKVDGIMLPNGSFGILVSQIPNLLPDSVTPNNATKYAKRILGINNPLLQIQVVRSDSDDNYNSRKLNYITIEELELLITRYAFKGDVAAQNLVEQLVGLSLTQLWSDAFKIKYEQEERLDYLENRQEHQKEFHTRLTPFWQEDGCEGKDYADRVIQFKDYSCLPKYKSVDDYTRDELKLLNIQEVKYQTLREVGLSHEDAINKIRI